MFIGIYYHTLGPKGRVAIPAKFRRKLDNGSVLTRGLDGCLFLFAKSEWVKLADKLKKSPLTQKKARDFVRLLTHSANEVEFDSQGRTLIPGFLREFASLKRQVVIAGSAGHVEIWDKSTYHRYLERLENEGEQIAESLSELGI